MNNNKIILYSLLMTFVIFLAIILLNPSDKDILLDPSDKDILLDPSDEDILLDPSDKDILLDPSDKDILLDPSDKDISDNYQATTMDIFSFALKILTLRYEIVTKSLEKEFISETIYIEKNNLLLFSFVGINELDQDNLFHTIIKIKYPDEPVTVDSSGITRDWIDLVTNELFNESTGYFYYPTSDRTKALPDLARVNRSDYNIEYFEFLGILIGKMIQLRNAADIRFDKIIWKQILEIPCTLEDFREVDPLYFRNFNSQISYPDALSDLTFSEDDVEFIKGGSRITVNEDNFNEYVEAYLNYKYVTMLKPSIDLLKKGLYKVLDKDFLSPFDADELQLLVCGQTEIDVHDWQQYTKYDNYKEYDEIISWFWKIVETFTSEERSKLLQFTTGSPRLPSGGFKNIAGPVGLNYAFMIAKMEGGDDRYPQSHTCFNTIDIPLYSSYEILRDRLLIAIYKGNEGFGQF